MQGEATVEEGEFGFSLPFKETLIGNSPLGDLTTLFSRFTRTHLSERTHPDFFRLVPLLRPPEGLAWTRITASQRSQCTHTTHRGPPDHPLKRKRPASINPPQTPPPRRLRSSIGTPPIRAAATPHHTTIPEICKNTAPHPQQSGQSKGRQPTTDRRTGGRPRSSRH